MLTHKDKENILREFPNVKLSYENITHKKVYRQKRSEMPSVLGTFRLWELLVRTIICRQSWT